MFFHDLLGIDSGIEGVKLLLELSNFLLVFTKEGIFGVLVDTWLVLDVFGTTSIPKRVHSFIIVIICWTHVSNHYGLSIATERVLK
jgi:hypothetical protein